MKEALSLGCGAGVTVNRAFSWDRTQPLHSTVVGVASPFRLTPLSRTGRVWGFVRSRQTFVLGSHWRRMAMGSMVTVVSAHDDERRHRPQQ